MTKTLRSLSASAALAGVLLAASPAVAGLEDGTGRIEGRLRRPDGRPAAGYAIVLVDREGGTAGRTGTSPEGAYLFGSVPSGAYHMEVVDRQGRITPVAGPPASVARGGTLRQDLKLVHTDGTGVFARETFGPKADSWWSRRTRDQKIWTVASIAVGAGVLLAVANNLGDDDDEAQASPSSP